MRVVYELTILGQNLDNGILSSFAVMQEIKNTDVRKLSKQGLSVYIYSHNPSSNYEFGSLLTAEPLYWDRWLDRAIDWWMNMAENRPWSCCPWSY